MKNAHYQEYPPSPRLAQRVECFWTMRTKGDVPAYPVMPDGCVDILFARQGNARTEIAVVGAMTRRRDFAIPSGRFQFGVRFHPAMGRAFLRAPIQELTNQIVPLDAIRGGAARVLLDQLTEARSVGQAIARAESFLGEAPALGLLERAATWLLVQRGQVSVDDLARSAGLSARQFRRVCLDSAGLTPKRLARIIRFRHALAQIQVRRGPGHPFDWAQFALECGYYDQAHLINEFREFADAAPAEYVAARLGRLAAPLPTTATAEAAD